MLHLWQQEVLIHHTGYWSKTLILIEEDQDVLIHHTGFWSKTLILIKED
jgi:hypothetical protein